MPPGRPGQPAPAGSRGETAGYVQQYMTDANYTFIERLAAWAEPRGHTPAETAQAWLLAKPEVCSVISGATRLEQMQANAKAADWVLTPEEVTQIDELLP